MNQSGLHHPRRADPGLHHHRHQVFRSCNCLPQNKPVNGVAKGPATESRHSIFDSWQMLKSLLLLFLNGVGAWKWKHGKSLESEFSKQISPKQDARFQCSEESLIKG